MDVYSNASSWLQHSPTQVAQPSPVVQNDIAADSRRPSSSNDWKDRPPSASDPNGAPQSLETFICTTLAWATFLVSTACTPSPACSQFSLTGYFQRHRLPLHPSLLRLPSSTTP